MPSFLHSLFHPSHSSLSAISHLHSPPENKTNRASPEVDMRKSRPSSPLPPAPVQLPKSSTAPPTPAAALTSDKEKDIKDGPRPKHKRIFSLTRQVSEPVTAHASFADKETSSKNGREREKGKEKEKDTDTDTPAASGTTSTSPSTTNTKSASPSAAPSASRAHAPTLALLNGERTPSHKHSSSLPPSRILFTPPQPSAPASSPSPAPLSKTPSPEQPQPVLSQPPSARSSTIVVSSSLPTNLANLSVAEDVSRRSSFRHMFRRTNKEHKDKRREKRHWGHHAKCPDKCTDAHSSREAFSDGEDMSPVSLDSSIDYESAFKAVMVENIKLREEIAELRRRASLPVSTLNGHLERNDGSFDVGTVGPTHATMRDLEASAPGLELEKSVRELNNAIRAVPGRILVIVLIVGFVSIIRSWKFDSCVYVV